VFVVVAEERNEPNYNPALLSADLLTEEPVGVGAQFKAVHTSGRGPMEMTVELTEYDPPRRIASITTALGRDPRSSHVRGSWRRDPAALGVGRSPKRWRNC
jgi:hypothetical protein